jgi:hypothetical protein
MNASATSAVPDSFARFRIIASGMKMINWAKIMYRVGIKVRQSVTAMTNAWRFSAIKMV